MHDLSSEAETAMLFLLKLWPTTMAVTTARWFESDLRGENGTSWPVSVVVEAKKERMFGIDQTWMFESAEPDRRKLAVGSMARHVVGWR